MCNFYFQAFRLILVILGAEIQIVYTILHCKCRYWFDQCEMFFFAVDGNTESCVGQIVIVSTKLGSPIATRSVALVPQMSSNSLGAANAIECASGGDRKKIVCTFHNSGKFYVIDMKAKCNY